MDAVLARIVALEQELVAANARAATERDARLTWEAVYAQQSIELCQAVSDMAGKGGNGGQQNVDTRLLAKPKEFNGTEKAWKDWKFTFKAYMAAVNRYFAHELKEAVV